MTVLRVAALLCAGASMAGLLAGCAALRPRVLTPEELAGIAERELEDPMPMWPVKLEDDRVEAQAEARVAPVVKVDGVNDLLALPIGTEEPVRCRRLLPRSEVAGLLHARIGEARPRVQVRAVEVTALEPAGGAAVLFADVTYVSLDGRSMGTLKLAVAPGDRRTFFCEHDEPGYAKTFRRIVVQLVASARRAGEEPPDFWDAVELKRDGQLIGLLTRRQRGAEFTSVESSLLPGVGGPGPRALDVVTAETSDPDGRLRAQRTAVTRDGKVELEVALQRRAATLEYDAEGTAGGQPLKTAFRVERPLVATPLLARLLAAGASRREQTVAVEVYRPGANPAGPISREYRFTEGGRVEELKHRDPRNATLDAAGMAITWVRTAHGGVITARRISRHGALRN